MVIFFIILALFLLIVLIDNTKCPHCKSKDYEDIMPGVQESRKCRNCNKMHSEINE